MDGRAAKGHGRQCTPWLQAPTELNDFLARDWAGVGQVFCLRRRVPSPLKWTQEYVYGLTQPDGKTRGNLRLLELIQDHWGSENRLHDRRDVALAEDGGHVREGTAPHGLVVLNSFVLALFDCCGVTNITQHMRCFAARPLFAALLLLQSLTEK